MRAKDTQFSLDQRGEPDRRCHEIAGVSPNRARTSILLTFLGVNMTVSLNGAMTARSSTVRRLRATSPGLVSNIIRDRRKRMRHVE